VAASLAVATTRRVRVVSQLLLAGGLVFVLLRLGSTWNNSHIDLARVDWWPLTIAFFAVAAAVAAAASVWLRILRDLGIKARPRWAGIYLQAQLAKYLPGSVWQYAGRLALARDQAIAVRIATISITIELAAAVSAAALLALLAGGLWGAVAAAGVLVASFALWTWVRPEARLRRLAAKGFRRRDIGPVVRAIAAASAAYVGVMALLGVALWLVADALLSVPAAELPFYAGAFSLAWLAGLVAVFAPGGLGVREAVLVALLRGRLGTADAVLLAAASRVLLTLVDVVGAFVGSLLLRGVRPRESTPLTADVHVPEKS
jgi:uncharacterized membrane protein YbhN (UPF0104 family)